MPGFCGIMKILFWCVKQKTAYELRISDWSSDVCSSDLGIFMDDECLAAMLERGTFLVPPLAAVHNIVGNRDKGIPMWAVEKAERVYEIHKVAFRRFYEAGQDRHGHRCRHPVQPAWRSEERRGGKEWVSPCDVRW